MTHNKKSPLPLGDDSKDGGGRATQGAVAEGENKISSLSMGESKSQQPPLPQGEGRGEGGVKGEKFSPEQLTWLNQVKDQIAQNAEMSVDDFEYTPFNQEGGLLKARKLFGRDLNNIIQELNGYLIA